MFLLIQKFVDLISMLFRYFLQIGFQLNNKFGIVGPMVIFPRTVLSWNIGSVDEIDEHSLRLFLAMEPKLELLIIGTGNVEVKPELYHRILKIVKPYGIRLEVLKTEAVRMTQCYLMCSHLINCLSISLGMHHI